MNEINRNIDGCWNCVHDFFGECEIYMERNENGLKGVSVCDYEHWEREE